MLGFCEADIDGRRCGVLVTREGYPPHGGPVSSDHGFLVHRDGLYAAGWPGYHPPVIDGEPDFKPGPRCTVPEHDH